MTKKARMRGLFVNRFVSESIALSAAEAGHAFRAFPLLGCVPRHIGIFRFVVVLVVWRAATRKARECGGGGQQEYGGLFLHGEKKNRPASGTVFRIIESITALRL